MGTLISRISTFLNLPGLAAITLPGMIVAAAVAIYAWPPPANDFVRTGANCQFGTRSLPRGAGTKRKAIVQANQDTLERASEALRECIAREASRLGEDSAAIADIEYQIAVEAKERDSLQAQYLRYANSGSDLTSVYRARYQTVATNIANAQKRVQALRVNNRQLKLNIALDSQYLATIETRLQDPGRLRTKSGINDLWSALTDHVIGFLALSLVIGYAVTPVNTMLFGALYDRVAEHWNRLRKTRYEVVRPSRDA